MLTVTNFAGTRTEPFFTTSAPIFEQDNVGNLSLEFTVNKTKNEVGFNLLQEESVVTAAEYRFRVKQIDDDKPGRKTIVAISTFFDLSYSFKSSTFGGTHTINEFLNYLFAGTGWVVTCDFMDTATIRKFGTKNIIQCVNQICDAFNCEFEILPNNRVHFSKSIGPDNGAQYRYGHNIKALGRKVDTNQLRTQITVTGKEGLTVTYTSPNHTIWGVRPADPISDERFTDPDNLMKKGKDSIVDYPEVSFELDTLELLDKALGEKVWLIYEPIDGLELQTRILHRTCFVDELTDELKAISVKLGNSLPRTSTDDDVDTEEAIADTKEELTEVITENKKEYRSKFEQTDNRITLEVEHLNNSIATVDIKADNISLSVNNRITNEVAKIDIRANKIELSVTDLDNNLSSKITQTATQIRSEVSSQVTTINNNIQTVRNDVSTVTQTAAQIQSTVWSQQTQITSMGTRVSTAESSITQVSNQITMKVSYTDYNGSTIISKINQDPYSVSIDAQKINLNGAVIVNGSISGATNIDVNRDVTIGNTLYLRGWGRKAVQFDNSHVMETSGGDLDIHAMRNVSIGPFVRMSGTVDFSGANVLGLNSGGNYAAAHTSGIGIAYSPAARRLYVRINGSDVGYVTLT